MVFRRDRIACTGAQTACGRRGTDASKTRRMIAGCCAEPMYLAFDDKRPWVSAFRASFGDCTSPVVMRICTRFRRSEAEVVDGLRSRPGYPLGMMVRIMPAWPLMLFSRPARALP
jgi:hypothetical protein